MPSIERANGIPVQILQSDRKPHIIGQRETVRENGRTYSPALIFWEQVKFSESQVIWQPLKRQRSKSLLSAPYLEERLLAAMALMQISLKCFIPSPSLDDVRPHSRSFGFESKANLAGIVTEQSELQIRREVRDFHAMNLLRS